MIHSTVLARRPDSATKEEIWTRGDLKEIMRNLSLLSEHGVREFYERAYRERRIVNSHTFPPARAVQELVQAWKPHREWRRPGREAMHRRPRSRDRRRARRQRTHATHQRR